MATPHMDHNNSSNFKHQFQWTWLRSAVILIGIVCLASACSPTAVDIVVQPQDILVTGEAITSTALSTIPETEENPTAVPTIAASPTSTLFPTAIPSLTPIPTASAAGETEEILPLPATEAPEITTAAADATKPPPLPTPSGVYSWTLKVPILMYHYISSPPKGADKYRVDLSVTPADFQEQMDYLADNGFETVDLYDLSLAITNKIELPPKPVIITLDDGYRDNYENAFPILQEHGFEANFFVVTQFIDNNLEDYMSWEMVEEMYAAGMRIEPHSKTHPDLTTREREYIIYEILGSMETIAAHTGERPRFFCYPGGRYDDTTLEVVEELDFWGAVTTASGDWHGFNERFEWSRVRMRNTTSLSEFIDMVDPGNTVSGKIAGS